MYIIGFDPGYERLGVAVLEYEPHRTTLRHLSCIRTDKQDDFTTRVGHIGETVAQLFASWQPKVVALEKVFFNKNQKTATAVAEIVGVLRLLAFQHNALVAEYTPPQVKVALTGNGRASKQDMMRMVPLLVSLPEASRTRLDDEFDAVAVALTAAAHASVLK